MNYHGDGVDAGAGALPPALTGGGGRNRGKYVTITAREAMKTDRYPGVADVFFCSGLSAIQVCKAKIREVHPTIRFLENIAAIGNVLARVLAMSASFFFVGGSTYGTTRSALRISFFDAISKRPMRQLAEFPRNSSQVSASFLDWQVRWVK